MPMAVKNRPSSRPSNGRDVGLDLVAVVGIGQQHAGDEGAERGGQPGLLHHQRHADHGQQRAGRHGLLHARAGDETDDAVEQIAPDHDHRHDGADGLERPHTAPWAVPSLAPRRQTAAPARSAGSPPGPGTAAPRTPGGRGAAPARPSPRGSAGRTPSTTATSARPANSAAGQASPKAMAMPASTSAVDRDLRAAEAEDRGAHGPQALGPQLQADQEQQQHHAELGKVQDRVHVVDRIDEAQRRTARSARRPAGSPARCRCAAAWPAAPPPPRRPERGRFA